MDNDPWALYKRLQSMLRSSTNPYVVAGIEAAMTDLLGKIESGHPCTPKQVENLVINRTGRERRRRAMLYSRQHDLVREVAPESTVESRLMLAKCAEACRPREFELLVHRARGLSFVELAKATGANQNTLKVRAHRTRQKIRDALN